MLRSPDLRILRRTLACFCLAASLIILLPALATGAPAVLILLPVAALAAWNPFFAAAMAAVCTPIATSVMLWQRQGGDWAEMVVVALAAGSSARWTLRAQPLRLGRLTAPAAVLVTAIAASLAVQLLVLRDVLSSEVFTPALVEALRNYHTEVAGVAQVLHTAARLLEGVFLLTLMTEAAAHREQAITILRGAAVGGTLAALFNMWRLAVSAARTDHAISAFFELARTVRFSFPYPDVNAAGSYFTLLLLVATGIAVAATGSARARWTAAAGLIAAALWITGSRAAALASLAALVVLALRNVERRTAPYVITALVAVAATVIWFFPNPILNRSAAGALNVRLEMARASMRMLRADPLFGIGIGQFYERSGAYIQDPAVKAVYVRENAHNNFLQIGTELGALGLVSFLALICLSLSSAAAAWRTLDPSLAGAMLGMGAFLLTCMAGHPLLTSEVAAAFWIVLGCIAAGTRAAGREGRPPRRPSYVAVAACALAIASVPWRAHRDLATADLEHVGHGVSVWHRDDAGHLYRQMLREATLFVPRDVEGIELPYRLAQPGASVELEFEFRGRTADRVVVQDDEWRTRRLVVPRDASLPRFIPLTIKVLQGDPSTVWLGKMMTIGAR